MTEDKGQSSPSASETDPLASSGREQAESLPNMDDIHQGPAPQEILDMLNPLCMAAEESYRMVVGLIDEIHKEEQVLQNFHDHSPDITPADVDTAKNNFEHAKQAYLDHGNRINDSIRQVYMAARSYPEDLLLQKVYMVYLAKLLASLAARQPLQPFVAQIADAHFSLERPKNAEKDRGIEREEMERTMRKVQMLEARYQKRQLANRLRQGEPLEQIIAQLSKLIQQDARDVNSYIWMAQLLATHAQMERNQNTLIQTRDNILIYCQKGISMIDDYLELQEIQSINERDKIRAAYTKTITTIRRPFLERVQT